MKDFLVAIDKAGRVVLPKQVRDELAINPGDLLQISIHGNAVTLRPDKEKAGFTRRGQALVFSSGGTELLDDETLDNVRAAERGGLLNSIARGLPS